MKESHQATLKRVGPVLLTTLVPVVAALGFFAVAYFARTTPNYAAQPSMAAFDACMSANGLQRTGFASEFDQTVWQQEAMRVCGHELPPPDPSVQTAQQAARDAYRKCIDGFGVSRSRGFGRFRTGPSSEYRNAVAVCRAILQGSDEGGGEPEPTPKTTPAGPIA